MAVDMFLKIDDIEGESVDDVHAGEIDVLSWSWGMSQSGTTHSGPGGGAGKVNVQDLSFVHYVDKASANLMKMCCNGKHFEEAVLVVRKAGETPLEYMIITMKGGLISSVSTGGVMMSFNPSLWGTADKDCFDCRLRGGSLDPPYYWPTDE